MPVYPPFSAPTVLMSWLPPAVERLNSPHSPRLWPAPALPPLDLSPVLKERLLRGLLAACKLRLQHGHHQPLNAESAGASLCWTSERESTWFSSASLERQSTHWLAWLEEVELRQALRVLLAPVSAFGAAQTWKAALARQTALAARFAHVARLHAILAGRLGQDAALATLERGLAALECNVSF